MFDIVDKHKRATQIVIALISLPFAFFGVEYYVRSGSSVTDVATVAGEKITQAEFADAMREQQDEMRRQMGKGFDPAIFDNPEVRFSLLERLVNDRLLEDKAKKDSLRVTEAQIQDFIAGLPVFQADGKFSLDRYKQLLAGQNMSPAQFEARMRQQMTMAPLQEPIALGNIVAARSGERYIELLEQQREVALATIDPASFAAGVKVDDAAVKAFYDANEKAFMTPEQARFDYILLTQDALSSQVAVDAAEVRAQYDANAKQYTQGEERKASHILIAVKPAASDAERGAAKKKAEALTAQVKAAPAKFAELAKANSQDPGSAAQGGDLGAFARGSMVKPFDDAVFAMKPGEITGPVETDFGYHVIMLTGITPSKTRAFDEVRAQIETDLKRQRAAQKFAAAAEQLQNSVYEQADSLAGAGKATGIPVQTSALVTRTEAQAIALGNAKFVEALFGPESIQGKRNTEAVEVGSNALMAGRVVEYKAAAPRPFDTVKDEIRRQLVRKEESDLAQGAGRIRLALLAQGKGDKEAGVAFGKPVTVTRNQTQPGFSPDGLKQIFQVDPARLPKFVGAVNERGGYSIYKVEKVIAPSTTDAAKLAAARARISDQLGREIFGAYLVSLKSRADIKINQANLEKK